MSINILVKRLRKTLLIMKENKIKENNLENKERIFGKKLQKKLGMPLLKSLNTFNMKLERVFLMTQLMINIFH